jgi:streptogramin lyase
VSAKTTVLADASTYAPLGSATGGVAAAFAQGRDDFAVLSNGLNGATVTFARGGSSVRVGGSARAITSLPGGGFAVLSDSAGRGAITLMAPSGLILATLDVPAGGLDLAYDDLTRKFSVIGTNDIANISVPTALFGLVPSSTANPNPSTTPLPTAQVTQGPAPTPTPTPAATEKPVVVIPVAHDDDLVPSGSRALWPGTYLVSVTASQRPVRSTSDGTRIWYLDDENRVNALNMQTGALLQIAALPVGATVTSMTASRDHVYFVDRAQSRVYALTISTEQLKTIAMSFATGATAIVASPDERLWLATAADGLVSYDPRSGQVQKIAVGVSLSVIATDALGRVWAASGDRQAIDVYDPLAAKLTEIALAHGGSVTALAVDRAGVVWVGTDTGQTFALRGAGTASPSVTQGLVGRPITGFSYDQQTTALLYVSRSPSAVAYGPLVGSSAPKIVPGTSSEPMFDWFGRAWQGDPIADGFYVTLPGGRP